MASEYPRRSQSGQANLRTSGTSIGGVSSDRSFKRMARAKTIEGVLGVFKEIAEARGVVLCAVKLTRGELQQEFTFTETGTEPLHERSAETEDRRIMLKAKFRGPEIFADWSEIDDLLHIAACLIDRLNLQAMLGIQPERAKKGNIAPTILEGLIGNSETLREVHHIIGKIAGKDGLIVLLQGESGTGKEIIAKGIHANSRRSTGPFVPINCAALPAELIESELFGHEQGAFTDAKKRKEGLFEKAKGGTLFLDEIGELDLILQSKLLRVLEERKFRRVGGLDEIPFNAAVIAASNLDLQAQSDSGKFRLDLYHRLSEIQIDLPPLRDRGDDVLIIAKHYIEKFNQQLDTNVRGLSPEVVDIFHRYWWPGNVRQLRNVIKRAMYLEDGNLITTTYLPPALVKWKKNTGEIKYSGVLKDGETFRRHLDRHGLEIIRLVSDEYGGNKTKTAQRLGIKRTGLIHWEKRARARLRRKNNS